MTHLFFLALSLATPDLAALKKDVRAVAKPAGCTQAAQCKAMPMGAKPCGGPTEFVIYCSVGTDEKVLTEKVQAATDAEKAKNAATGAMGTCLALAQPKVTLVSGVCTAVEQKAADVPM